MFLSKFGRDIDHNGTVTLTALGEQTKECSGDEVYREHVDLVQICPLVGRLFVKQGHSEGLGIGVLWRVSLVQKSGNGTDLSGAEVLWNDKGLLVDKDEHPISILNDLLGRNKAAVLQGLRDIPITHSTTLR